MNAIVTDENLRLKDFGHLMNSDELKDYIKSNLHKFCSFNISLDTTVVDAECCKSALNDFFTEKGLYITNNTLTRFYTKISDAFYVQDLYSKEYIGVINIKKVLPDKVNCYATDVNDCVISDLYNITKSELYVNPSPTIDWSRYNFKEETKTTTDKKNIKLSLDAQIQGASHKANENIPNKTQPKKELGQAR